MRTKVESPPGKTIMNELIALQNRIKVPAHTLKSVLLTCSKTKAGVRDCNRKILILVFTQTVIEETLEQLQLQLQVVLSMSELI